MSREKITSEKKQLIHELLHKTSLEDLQMLLDYKKKMHTKPIPLPRTKKTVKEMTQEYEDNIIQPPIEFMDKPIPMPRTKKTVKEMTQEYEDNIIQPPIEFMDKPIPMPRTKKTVKEMTQEYEDNTIQPPIEFMDKPIPMPRTIIKKTAKALKGYATSYKINIKDDEDPLLQLQNTRLAIKNHIKKLLTDMKGIKFNETLKITFWKPDKDKLFGRVLAEAYFNSKPQTIINDINISELLEVTQQQILDFITKWISKGSGWMISSIDSHHINIVKYQPIKGSSYIQLPQELRNSAKGLINLKNNDNECFRWCHIRYLNPQDKYPQRIKKVDKEYIDKLNYEGIEFPVTIKQLNKIEKQNEININVFGYEKRQPYPIYISKENHKDHMELLLITKDENKHYVLIKDFNKFMFNQTNHKNKKYFCMHCLQCFSSDILLNEHNSNCIQVNGTQAIKMPDKDNNILKFINFHKQQQVPFVIYADFEAIIEKISGCKPNNDKSYTEAYQKHTDCGYAYKLVCCYDDKYTKPVHIYRGEKAVYKFMESMLEEVKYCKKIIRKCFKKTLKMSKDDSDVFEKATECYICKKQYTNDDIRVRDHCHITGKFRGSAHQDCNLKLTLNSDKIKIPVIFHNLRGYDSHFIMQEIGAIVKNHPFKNKKGEEKHMNINAIPNNMEKYMAFMLGNHLTFIDSFQFMSSSLEKLAANLPKDAFKYTSQEYKDKKFDLMVRKGVYPYDYMDSFDKFKTKLPNKEEFHSLLNDEDISNEDYQHAQNIWEVFKLNNMGEYHDLYLKSDILLLADIFENFRRTCLEYYKLDPCHYFTSPGLSWDAMLKMTDIKLELMTNIDMFQFIEKGLRGGISYIANRYGKANNKYMKEYDKNIPSKYIMYLDANNLYGYAMSLYLPTGGFRWMTEKQIDQLDLVKYNEDGKKGLILEIDLEYPKELHNTHNDYPLGAEKMKVSNNMLSDYSKKIVSKFNTSTGLVYKLIPTLNNKEKYVLHYRNLQLYIDLGLKVTKIHRVLEFDQSPWLKKYINFNTEKRTNAKNAFEKDFFKLMNNSCFGKTMENVRKRVDVRLITDEKKLLKMTSKPTYVSCKIFNENLVTVHKIKETLTLNRPAYIGMCILDLSKTLMYDFHYNYIINKYEDKAKLLFTDTDSLTYEIEADDVYQDFWNDREKFDNSDYPENSPFYDKTNKKVIGKFKDEAAGIPIYEFIGLRSKMYSYIKDNNEVGKTAKGIKKNIIKKEITHENYKKVLFNNEQMHHTMKTIRSNNHQLGSYEINKVSLSCFDDKRYIHNNGVTSYAYGHYKIHKQ